MAATCGGLRHPASPFIQEMDSLLLSSSQSVSPPSKCNQSNPKEPHHQEEQQYSNFISHHMILGHRATHFQEMPPLQLAVDHPGRPITPRHTKTASLGGPHDNIHYSLCTESLGSESSDDIDFDDLMDDVANNNNNDNGSNSSKRQHCEEEVSNVIDDTSGTMPRMTRTRCGREFPPPISLIGTSGKPRVYFRKHIESGRLVLKEMRIPNQELLQASRKDGRLKLQFVRHAGKECCEHVDVVHEEEGGETEEDRQKEEAG